MRHGLHGAAAWSRYVCTACYEGFGVELAAARYGGEVSFVCFDDESVALFDFSSAQVVPTLYVCSTHAILAGYVAEVFSPADYMCLLDGAFREVLY